MKTNSFKRYHQLSPRDNVSFLDFNEEELMENFH